MNFRFTLLNLLYNLLEYLDMSNPIFIHCFNLLSEISFMSFKLPDLPYGKDQFPGTISVETFDYHYGKHHQTYVNNLNNLVKGTEWEQKSLDDIVLTYLLDYLDAKTLRSLTMLLSIGITLSIGTA